MRLTSAFSASFLVLDEQLTGSDYGMTTGDDPLPKIGPQSE
jgi:hypothetical protein